MLRRVVLIPAFSALLAIFLLTACNEDSSPEDPGPLCPDQDVLPEPEPGSKLPAHAPERVSGARIDSVPGVRFVPGDSVAAHFGGKRVKLAFVLDYRLYLAEWEGGELTLSDLTNGDEGFDGAAGNLNSPLFSPDGEWLAYGGSLARSSAMAFVRQAVSGDAEAWRLPVDVSGRYAFDPHFVVDGDTSWVYYATSPGPDLWNDRCGQMGGATLRVPLLSDSALGAPQATGLPGAFKGGLSKDLRWAGTSYGPSALYDRDAERPYLLANLVQQCNPSMNPFPAGSPNADYLMVLGFGGKIRTVGGDVTENIHENLWIYGMEDRAVWRGRLPPDAKYEQWQKPEWSAHPGYATGIALYDMRDGRYRSGDLYAVRIGDLASRGRESLAEAEGHVLLAEGGLNESSFSHLWIEP